MAEKIGFLFINGLGNGATTPKDRVVKWWWRRADLDIEHAHINWFDESSLADKLDSVEKKVDEMLGTFGGVAIIGSSAGGSLAINSFYRLRAKNVCVINAHGRLGAGDYPNNHRMSLYRRAYLGTDRSSESFYDSAMMAETQVIPQLAAEDKERVLTLTQLTDLVVPLSLMQIDGTQNHRSFAFGHSGGFLAHLLADRDLISNFAHTSLK